MKSASRYPVPTPGLLLKTIVFTVLVPGVVAVVIPLMLLASSLGRFHFEAGAIRLLGAGMVGLGIAGYLWCAWDFAAIGRGTPFPLDAPKSLVIQGPYLVVRNPMYVSVLLTVAGESLFFESWTLVAYAALLWVVVHLFVVFVEEPGLRKKFGPAYERYLRAVPRWVPAFTGARRSEPVR